MDLARVVRAWDARSVAVGESAQAELRGLAGNEHATENGALGLLIVGRYGHFANLFPASTIVTCHGHSNIILPRYFRYLRLAHFEQGCNPR